MGSTVWASIGSRRRLVLRRHSGARRPNSGLPEFGVTQCPSRQQPTWMARARNPYSRWWLWIPGSTLARRPGMTKARVAGQASVFPRRDFARAVLIRIPREHRGRREGRALVAPAASCASKKAHELETTGSTNAIRPSLHDGVTAYTRSPRCAGLFSHRRRRLVVRQLDLSVGRPGPRDFAVRPGSLVWRPRAAIASRAQRP